MRQDNISENIQKQEMTSIIASVKGRLSVYRWVLAGLVVIMCTGCQSMTRISWDVPSTDPGKKGEIIATNLAEYGDDFCSPNTVGKHTFTLFAIPVSDIRSRNSIEEGVGKAIQDAIVAANYDVVLVTEPPKGKPCLSGTVDRFYYYSYMWFWPLMFEGGKIQVTLVLTSPQGKEVWGRSFVSSSFWATPGGAFGYDAKIRKAMTKLLADIQDEVLSEDFKAALR